MEAGAVGQPQVDVRRRVVEPAPAKGREPLGQAPDRLLVGEADRGELEAGSAVEVDPLRAVDQYVGHVRRPQQRLERAGPDDVAAQRLVDRQHGGVADRTARLAQRLGDPVRGQLARAAGQPVAHGLQVDRGDGGAHAAERSNVSWSSTSPAARPSVPRRERTGPRPRSIASASPRWSAIAGEHRDTRRPGDRRRVDPTTAQDQPDRGRVGVARADADRRGDTGDGGHDDDQQPVATGGHLVDQRVGRPGQVDHHQVVAALRRRQHLAHGEGLEAARSPRRAR